MTHYAPRIINYLLCLALLASCVRQEDVYTLDNNMSPEGNLEALWTIIDEHYCFFDYKQVDWDSVHTVYRQRLNASMNNEQLFEVMCDMLSELRDGHVNLSRAADVGRYWAWYEDYPRNYDVELQDHYLGTDYRMAAGVNYRILDDNIGYAVINSFSTGMGEGNLDEVMNYLRVCQGLIIDVRGNGGGLLSYAEALAARLTNEKRLVGYIMHKTGSGHSDFSEPVPEYLNPSDGIRWQKPVVVITNRQCYSSTNTFVRDVKGLPRVTILGDRTGGGSGMPFSSELPNGWSVRYSAVPMLDANGQHIEWGIEPDEYCSLDPAEALLWHDSMIERARELLKQ